MPNIEKIRVGETEYNITDSINIAPVEMSSTSANAYAVGDMLIYNGQLYEVISAIAVGNTLTVGTNIQASKVSAKIKEIDSNLSKNSFGTTVDIKTYTSAQNAYTCPVDGYVRVHMGGYTNLKGTIVVNGLIMLSFTGANDYPVSSLFVRKGMQVYCTNFSENTLLSFIPLA